VQEQGATLLRAGGQDYPTGFHSYATEKDADKALKIFRAAGSWQDRSAWVVVPCLVRDVIAVGYDGSAGPETASLKNLVSLRMKVLLQKKRIDLRPGRPGGSIGAGEP
jgi:hypothetical protein